MLLNLSDTNPKKISLSTPKQTRNFYCAHPQASNPKTSLSLLSPLGYSCSCSNNTSTNSRKTKLRLVFFFPPVPPPPPPPPSSSSSSYHTKLLSIVGGLSISFFVNFHKINNTTQMSFETANNMLTVPIFP
jgi:hypothetical protein